MSRLRLVTIPFSHYCEKVRWALERSGLEFEERRYVPVLHMMGTIPLGGRSVPLLVAGSDRFTDSTDIALYIDSLTDEARRLYPADPGERKTALDLEEEFDRKLGPHTRRWVYWHLLNDRKLAQEFIEPFGPGGFQTSVFRTGFPVFSRMMKIAMRIDEESARRSLVYVRDVFNGVSERLSDGRRYLLGDRFTIADLTFAALGAPVLFPANYGGPTMPRMGDAPPSLTQPLEVDSFRGTRAGQFVMRLYDELRFSHAS